jgi:thiol:disulfide interchange protein
MQTLPRLSTSGFFAFVLAVTIMAGQAGASLPPSLQSAELIASQDQVPPGGQFYLAVELKLAKDWVYYSPQPTIPGGEEVLPAGLTVHAGPIQTGTILWPMDHPHYSDFGGGTPKILNFVYEGRTLIYIPLSVPTDTPAGRYEITVSPIGQTCGPIAGNLQCLDFARYHLQLVKAITVGQAGIDNPQWASDPALAEGLKLARPAEQLAQAHAAQNYAAPAGAPAPPGQAGTDNAEKLSILGGLGLALLAGLILNIMPCVLPVIPLKLLSIAQMSGQCRRRFITLGLAFVAGILLFFIILAGANAALQIASQQTLHWGEHFKSTGFRIAMALLVVAVAANLFGLFTVNAPGKLANLAGQATGHGHLSAAGSGLLTAILSTPCSFAFLTSAFAWAQVQPIWLGCIAITTLGVGMSLPYLLLLAFPKLLSRLPKPGRWMELLRQSLGFVMLLVALWLIGSINSAAGDYALWVVGYGVVLAFCLWMWGSWLRYDAALTKKLAIAGLAVAIAVSAGLWMLRPPKPAAVHFEAFDQARLVQARQAGRIVLVDFTASWCLTCKAVEEWIFNDASVAAELASRNVLAMKGDVTTSDLPANDMLYRQLNEPAIPVTVIFPPGQGPPIRLYGLYSKADLFKALAQAGGANSAGEPERLR